MKEPIITHDDRLILRVLKHKAGLADDWWHYAHKTGEITGYYNEKTGERHGASFVPPDDPAGNWKPCYKRRLGVSEGVYFDGYDNIIELSINNLWNDFGNRYRTALEAILKVQPVLLDYKPTAPISPRNTREAFRYRLRNQWNVARYEHNLLFDKQISEIFFREIQSAPTQAKYENTLYFKGYDDTKKTSVKAYRMTKHDMPDNVKIEVTLRYNTLRGNKLQDPNIFTTQPEIQAKIAKLLKKEWVEIMKYTPETKQELRRHLKPEAGLFDALAAPEHTFEAVFRRIEAVEAELKSEITALSERVKRIEDAR